MATKAVTTTDVPSTNDQDFIASGYNATTYIGDHVMLKMIQATKAESPAAYHIAKAFSHTVGNEFFHNRAMFPLRSFVKKKDFGVGYIKKLASNTVETFQQYAKDSKLHSATTIKPKKAAKRKSAPSPARAPAPLRNRYTSKAPEETVRHGVESYDWKFLNSFFLQRKVDDNAQRKELRIDPVRNIDKLLNNLGVDAVDKEIFKYLYAEEKDERFGRWLIAVSEKESAQIALAAAAAGTTPEDFRKRIGPQGDLGKKGLITFTEEKGELPTIAPNVSTLLENSTGSHQDFVAQICGTPAKTDLTVDDYAHLEEDIEYAKKLLRDAIDNQKKGVNILLHSQIIGTGKRSLATVLADEINKDLYRPCEHENKEGNGMTPAECFKSLGMTQALLKGSKSAILMVDSMEDLLPAQTEDAALGTTYINGVLENNPVPVIWVIGDIEYLENVFLSRFTWNIEVTPPARDARVKTYERIAQKMGREIVPEDASYLAARYNIAPSLIQKAFEFDKAVAPGDKTIKENLIASIKNTGKVLYADQSYEWEESNVVDYDMNLANISVAGWPMSPKQLGDRLRGTKEKISVLSYGISGAGKSAHAVHFAHDVLKKEVLRVRYADITGDFAGSTEIGLRRVFKEAKRDDKVLIIDEGDTLLQSRAGNPPLHRWEINEVNAMLQELEDKKVSVIVTTNLEKNMDDATSRRFQLKFKFDQLKADQLALCYEKYFKRPLPEKHGLGGYRLAIGDFNAVGEVYNLFHQNMEDEEIQNFLIEGAKAKGSYRQGVGFGSK